MPEAQTRTEQPAGIIPQVLKFGAVGGLGVLVNAAVFNGLMLTVFAARTGIHHGPIYATIIATLVAIVTNWIGNRYWAFAKQRQTNTVREGVEFFLVSLAGMGIPLLCLWLSHYVFGFSSLIADNIANYGVGLALGMIFRFALYRWWVFAPDRSHKQPAEAAPARPAGAGALARTPDGSLIGDS